MTKGILKEFATTFDIIHRMLDVVSVVLGAILAHYFIFGHIALPDRYQTALLVGMLLSMVVFRWFPLYQSWRGLTLSREIQQVGMAWATTFIGLTFIAFLLKTGADYSRLWAGTWGLLTLLLLTAVRVTLRIGLRWLRSSGHNTRTVAVVGATPLSANVIERLHNLPWAGLRVVGVFDEDPESPHVGSFHGAPVLGGHRDVAAYVERNNIDQVWICLPLRAEEQVREVVDTLSLSTIDIRFVPDIFGFSLVNHSLSEVAGVPIINLSATPFDGWNRVIKAVEDRLLALVFLLLCSPVMLAIAIGIKLTSPGPVIFRQMRNGWDGKPIEIWKFRSMKVHTEHDGTVTQAQRNDPRLTPFGAFLRRTSLDELPQFINVLQGRMSIVGPRPHAVEHNEFYKLKVNQYMSRHKVKPGITGWAQINGYRGETDTLDKMQNRVKYDLYYIENWSLWLDIKIVFLTILKGFRSDNAY